MRAVVVLCAAVAAVHAACPDLAALRSPYVAANFSTTAASGLFYQNRYTDLAQIGASCQMLNNTPLAAGNMGEVFQVEYGTLPFPLTMQYTASAGSPGLFTRSISMFPELGFPSVVVDVDVGPNGQYRAITEYLCWDIPLLDVPYVEVRISTRSPAPGDAYLDELESRARALGVTWSGSLNQVNYTGCPAWKPTEVLPEALPLWATKRISLAHSVPPVSTGDATDDVVVPGIRPGLPQLAFVFIQGAGVTPSAYVPFFNALQSVVDDFDVIVGAPDAPLDHTPDPITLGDDVTRILTAMQAKAGLDLDNAVVVFGGHSMGGTMLQLFLNTTLTQGYTPAAQVLFGAYLLRYVRNPVDEERAFKYPTATIVGELDGLTRVSRIAEAYWHQQTQGAQANKGTYPVLVVPGMNHGQLARFNGTVPPTIAQYDLTPEITQVQALAAAAQYTALFLSAVVGNSSVGAVGLAKLQASTATFLHPLVDALELEASYFLKPPCYDNPPSPACELGCPYSPIAQALLVGAAGSNGSSSFPWSVIVDDAMHPVDDIDPIHLPNVTNSCPAPNASCTLDIATVTQNSYDDLWTDFDVALYPMTAHETRVKMISRQNALVHAGVNASDVNFNVTDPVTLCGTINRATYEWAIGAAGAHTSARFAAKGVKYAFGPDTDAWMGPQFTYGSLQFQWVNGSQAGPGSAYVWVNSTTLRTPLDYILPLTAGFHYCLLLSPARALEWVYVDSLRSFLVA